jgi:predicted NUDIX family NTP pyrophosphohydrolase
MARKSAGILLFRSTPSGLEVLLAHPGGPFWAKKDDGAWTIPKGEIGEDEEPLAAAKREFAEEMGVEPDGRAHLLAPVRQAGGKIVHAWAMLGDFDPVRLKSNTFSMEWPPRSGRRHEFPEVDRAAWFTLEEARRKISKGQLPLLAQLEAAVERAVDDSK